MLAEPISTGRFHALDSTWAKAKIEAIMAERIHDINPEVPGELIDDFLDSTIC